MMNSARGSLGEPVACAEATPPHTTRAMATLAPTRVANKRRGVTAPRAGRAVEDVGRLGDGMTTRLSDRPESGDKSSKLRPRRA